MNVRPAVFAVSKVCCVYVVLLDRVFLRLGNADSDEQLESCLTRFLPPVILKLSSPHEQVYFLNSYKKMLLIIFSLKF